MNVLGRFQLSLMVLVSAVTVLVCAGEAFARPGGGVGLSNRGLRSMYVSPSTRTAPGQATPLDRSAMQPGALNRNGAAATPRAFQRPGLLGGLAAGFMGAGLLGMLFGNGFLGGLGGFASILGLLAQIAVVAGIAWLAWSWWQRRGMPAIAGLSPRQLADAYDRPRADFAALPGGAAFTADLAPNGVLGPLELRADDFHAFERLLGEIQIARARADETVLRPRVTPGMLTQFAKEVGLQGFCSRHGMSGDLRKVTLLKGNVSEAWRERDADYASVAMLYALDRSARVECTEVWTFRRALGGEWQLSAIQQT